MEEEVAEVMMDDSPEIDCDSCEDDLDGEWEDLPISRVDIRRAEERCRRMRARRMRISRRRSVNLRRLSHRSVPAVTELRKPIRIRLRRLVPGAAVSVPEESGSTEPVWDSMIMSDLSETDLLHASTDHTDASASGGEAGTVQSGGNEDLQEIVSQRRRLRLRRLSRFQSPDNEARLSDSDSEYEADVENIVGALESLSTGDSEREVVPAPTRTHVSTSGQYHWTKDGPHQQDPLIPYPLQPHVRSRGLSQNPTEIACFSLMFPNKVFELMTEMTNKNYARKSIAREQRRSSAGRSTVLRRKHMKEWTNVTLKEMKAFTGLMAAMGVVRVPRIHMYWRGVQSFFHIPSFGEIMTRDRFADIHRHLHFSEPEVSVPDDQPSTSTAVPTVRPRDKLQKIRVFSEILRERFRDSVVLSQQISIDESMIPFKGPVSFRQFLPAKRTRFGIKVYVLADSKTSYVSNFQVYLGKDERSDNRSRPQTSLGEQIVLQLLEGRFGLGHHLYIDNYYTSPSLLELLFQEKTYACGTVRVNRKGFPKDLIISKQNMKIRGYMDYRVAGNILCHCWNDNKAVYVMSTIHKPPRGDEEIPTVRRRKKNADDSGIHPCPPSIKDYNQYMGGVDMSDQLRKYYNISRKSKIWYRKVFGYLLEVAIHNARIVYQMANDCKADPIVFREGVIRGLIGDHHASVVHRFRVSTDGEGRLDSTKPHWPIHCEDGKNLTCKYCNLTKPENTTNSNRSVFLCQYCKVHLCLQKNRNCFYLYHTDTSLYKQ